MLHFAADLGSLLARPLSWMLAATRFAIKIVAGGLAVVLAVLLLGVIVYDVLYFQPRRAQIERLVASATEEERSPPKTVVRLMCADRTDPTGLRTNHVSLHASQVLIHELKVRDGIAESGVFQTVGALWWLLTWTHLSEQQQTALIASRLNMGRGLRGYSAASSALFNRPLGLLSAEEAATIVALPFMPGRYHSHPEDLARRRDSLLSKLKACP